MRNRFSLKSLLVATAACALLLALLRFQVGQLLVGAASILFLPGILTGILVGWYLGRTKADAVSWGVMIAVYWLILLVTILILARDILGPYYPHSEWGG